MQVWTVFAQRSARSMPRRLVWCHMMLCLLSAPTPNTLPDQCVADHLPSGHPNGSTFILGAAYGLGDPPPYHLIPLASTSALSRSISPWSVNRLPSTPDRPITSALSQRPLPCLCLACCLHGSISCRRPPWPSCWASLHQQLACFSIDGSEEEK